MWRLFWWPEALGRVLAIDDRALMRHEFRPDVYNAREIALAAGVPEGQVRALIAHGEIRPISASEPWRNQQRWQRLVDHAEAVRAVRALSAGTLVDGRDASGVGRLLAPPAAGRATTTSIVMSTSIHGLALALVLIVTNLGLTTADERTDPVMVEAQPVRLVFLAQPGPGGGGGGGGLRMRTPPPKAERKGRQQVSSPIPVRRVPPPLVPPPRVVEPPPVPLEAKTLPPVMAPVAAVAADTRNREGQLADVPKDSPVSHGPGSGGGAGTGQGTGIGEGNGSGVGPGEGGGIGGGPYRPGSGVEPPRLLREVRADYTDEARRSNVTGEVVLEIVVRRDGTVGDMKVLRRLGSGLDQRAADAVRQWRFAPARLKGVPVDVVVEVAVEFKLR
jgi:TonB family protein